MMKRPVAAACCAGICVFLFTFLSMPFCDAAPQAESVPTPTFRMTSHLVLVDVVVMDHGGNPVQRLHPEDFVVKENGQPQDIAFTTPPKEAHVQAIPAPLPIGVYSNQPAYRLPGGVPAVILLDAANTPFKDQLYARRQMLKFLKDQYKPGQRVAVFTLTDKLSLLQDFTGDPKVLLASLKRFDPVEPAFSKATSTPDSFFLALPPGSQHEYQALTAAVERFQHAELQYVTDRRAEVTLDALRRITRILGGMPGRKNVIWLTAGFPFNLIPGSGSSAAAELSESFRHFNLNGPAPNSEDILTSLEGAQYAERIRDISAQMATCQVAIYPVDVRGLLVSAPLDIGDRQETMREIARETGGRAFVNRNDVDKGVALVFRDHAASYTLGYYPKNKNWDRKYRSIEVKVNRPAVQVTYRRGYFAVDPEKRGDRKQDQDLADAWQDEVPDTLVSFEAKVAPIDRGKTRVEFWVDVNSLSVTQQATGRKFDVEFYVAAFSPERRMLSLERTKLDRAFPEETYQKILQQGMRLHLDADAPPGANEWRLAVRDNRTGYIGTLRAPILGKQSENPANWTLPVRR
jgi:VWFA-related protein